MKNGNQLGQYGVTQTGPDNFESQLIIIKTVFLGIKYDLNISINSKKKLVVKFGQEKAKWTALDSFRLCLQVIKFHRMKCCVAGEVNSMI